MTHHKKFKNESQDARRHDKHNATHPNEPIHPQDKTDLKPRKDSPMHSDKK